MQNSVKDQTVLITGAGLGIGKATALRFAEAGARIIVVDKDKARLEETLELIKDMGVEAISICSDVTLETDVLDMFQKTEAFGQLSILINNVGGGRSGRIWDLSVDDWDHTMALSLRSMFLCTRAALPGMIDRKHGRVICLSSGARNGTVWNAYHVGACAYATAKAGVNGFIRDLAIELADSGVTINGVAPGPIDTELAGPYLRKMHAEKWEYDPIRMTPMHRLGTPREVADSILFLASPAASYITGTMLDVTGGR